MQRYLTGIYLVLILWLVVGAWRLRTRRSTPGAAAAAMLNEILNDDRRAAVQIVVEERAAYRDPEHRDGDPPELGPVSPESA